MTGSALSSPRLEALGIAHTFLPPNAGTDVVDATVAHQPRQVHGSRVVRPERLVDRPADGVWSSRPGEVLGVRTADCVPVLMAHRSGAAAAIHAGWRGVAQQIVCRFLAKAERLGYRAVDWSVALGPAAGGCCYEVGAEVAVRLGFPERRRTVDLRRILQDRLGEVGTVAEVVGPCTICGGAPWASYRCQGEAAGRNRALIAVRPSRRAT